MTIDEAIEHAREVAEENREEAMNAFFPPYADECESCAEEHEQLASWLEELKDYRRFNGAKTFDNGFKQGEKYGYNKAIDDFVKEISIYGTFDYYENAVDVLEIANQLKKGELNETNNI